MYTMEALFGHVVSMLVDDSIELEVGGEMNGTHFHNKAFINAKGLGQLLKAGMIFKSAR